MKEFAVVKNDKIINVIVAEKLEAVWVFYPEHLIIERNEANGYGEIGGDLFEGYLRSKQPYPSWVWADSRWVPPVEMPQDGLLYTWNEATISWEQVEAA